LEAKEAGRHAAWMRSSGSAPLMIAAKRSWTTSSKTSGCCSRDGKFSGSTEKEDIMRVMFEHVYYSIPEEKKRDEDAEGEDVPQQAKEDRRKHKYRQSYYSAKFLRKALRLSEPVEEIMLWDHDKKIQVAIERMDDQTTYEGDDFSKCLIFISGNLDEAYRMAGDCSDTNHDADVLHSFSKKINIITIKNALMKRFKPEQISRFGNTHIIYPSLSRSSYAEIIQRKLDIMVDSIRTEHDISISMDQSVNDFIYRNGVYPAQGVRPLFSTISSYIENSLPSIVLAAIENGVKEVEVVWVANKLVATGENFKIKVKCEGVIDNIKRDNEYEKRVSTSVHEAGHAVAYAALFGLSPTQIIANTASDHSSGFVGIHSINHSLESVLDLVTVLMAGSVMEEMVFSRLGLTNGPQGDIQQATALITQAVREWGLFEYNSRIESYSWSTSRYCNHNNTRELNDLIEKVVSEQRAAAETLLKDHLALLKLTTDVLIEDGKIDPEEFRKLAAQHGLKADIVDSKFTIFDDFGNRYKKFFAKV
jgi:hypothetical protein